MTNYFLLPAFIKGKDHVGKTNTYICTLPSISSLQPVLILMFWADPYTFTSFGYINLKFMQSKNGVQNNNICSGYDEGA